MKRYSNLSDTKLLLQLTFSSVLLVWPTFSSKPHFRIRTADKVHTYMGKECKKVIGNIFMMSLTKVKKNNKYGHNQLNYQK